LTWRKVTWIRKQCRSTGINDTSSSSHCSKIFNLRKSSHCAVIVVLNRVRVLTVNLRLHCSLVNCICVCLVDFFESFFHNIEYHSAATMTVTRGDVTDDGCTVVCNFVANTIVFLGSLLFIPFILIFCVLVILSWCYDPPAPSSLENEQQQQQLTQRLPFYILSLT
jgi:hypothetical protein